jgi:polar amino acid transport system substrate-binding protein
MVQFGQRFSASCLIGLLAFAASSSAASAQQCLPKVADANLVKPGTLLMVTNPTLPPMQFVDSAGTLKGMRITLGEEVARRLCLKPEYIRIEFAAMIPGLQGGRWDLINTGIFWTEERAKIMHMVPYENQALSVSSQKGNPLKLTKVEDLAGLAVGVEIGGFEERKVRELDKALVDKGLKAMDIRTFDTATTAYQALRAGQVQAVANIDATAAEYAKRGEFDRVITGLSPTPIALAMKNKPLADAVTVALQEMQKDGSYQKLLAEYGLEPMAAALALKGPSS